MARPMGRLLTANYRSSTRILPLCLTRSLGARCKAPSREAAGEQQRLQREKAKERQQWLNALQRDGRRFCVRGLGPLADTRDTETLRALLKSEFAGMFPDAHFDVELLVDAAGESRGIGFITFADRLVAERALAEYSVVRADGQRCAKIALHGAELLLKPAWGQPAKVGRRKGATTLRRNASYFIQDHLAVLSAALEKDLRVGLQADSSACKLLDRDLRKAVVQGVPPSFGNEGARAQYAMERMPSRVGHVFDALLSQHRAARHLCAELFEAGRPHISVASVGGGPGFDSVALELVAAFLGSGTRLLQTVYEREAGWVGPLQGIDDHLSQCLERASGSSRATSGPIALKECDIALPLAHQKNTFLANAAEVGVELFVFSYIVHEVEASLRSPGTPVEDGVGGVFPGLFKSCGHRVASSSESSICAFLFLDTTPRLWPALAATARRYGFSCHLPGMLRSCSKPQDPLLLVTESRGAGEGGSHAAQSDADAERLAERFACFEAYLRASDRRRAPK